MFKRTDSQSFSAAVLNWSPRLTITQSQTLQALFVIYIYKLLTLHKPTEDTHNPKLILLKHWTALL
jgi:hypothetical protein